MCHVKTPPVNSSSALWTLGYSGKWSLLLQPDLCYFMQSELCSLMFVKSFCHKVRATFYKQITSVASSLPCMLQDVYRKKCWPTKPQTRHISLCKRQPLNTRLQVLHYSICGCCSFKSNRSFAIDSDVLHNAEFNMVPYRKQTSTKRLAHCANAHAF